jgi:hypothetical protein
MLQSFSFMFFWLGGFRKRLFAPRESLSCFAGAVVRLQRLTAERNSAPSDSLPDYSH